MVFIDEIKAERKVLEKEYEERKYCIHCKQKLQLGTVAVFLEKWICTNKECDHVKRFGYASIRDLSYEMVKIEQLKELEKTYNQGYLDGRNANE